MFSDLDACNFMQYWKCRSGMHLKKHKDTVGFVLYFIPKTLYVKFASLKKKIKKFKK